MLRDRILTALAITAFLLAVLFLMPGWATIVVLSATVLVGAWEWSAFIRGADQRQRLLFVGVVAALLPLVYWMATDSPALELVLLFVAAAFWIVAFFWITRGPVQISNAYTVLAGICSLVPLWLALAIMRFDFAAGAQWIVFTLVLVGFADTGAFFAGRHYGRTKLAPRVSPGKTWEGVVGAVVAGSLIAWIGAAWFEIRVLPFMLLCLAVIAFSVVGDLSESLLKRHAGLKDSGSLLRGHGGVLDRLDSVCAGAPMLLLGLRLTGLDP